LNDLKKYAHILKLERIEEIANSMHGFEDIDYSPVYDWDFHTEGFSIITDEDIERNIQIGSLVCNFYNAIKIRQYGHTNIEFPRNYLEDIDEFELSSSDINDLDGVQFCIHAKIMDLSDNKINDLSPLIGLSLLEDLNVSDNQIANLDVLSNLVNLKRLYLSNNYFDDISPLLELDKLEYVDLTGNEISLYQINQLKDIGVTVDY
jgi:Leucine-rich repeat (LRR) protein